MQTAIKLVEDRIAKNDKSWGVTLKAYMRDGTDGWRSTSTYFMNCYIEDEAILRELRKMRDDKA